MLNKRIYFFDYGIYNPHKNKNVRIKVNKAIKENIILFKEDEKWEVRYDNSYPNIFYDGYLKKYRAYYSTFTKDEESSKYSIKERLERDYKPLSSRIVSLCYAESKDGINWIKPKLKLCEFEGSYENNIIGHYLHGTSVFLDEHELDQNKRYKMFTKIDYGNGIHFLAVAFSKDGIHFDKLIKLDDFNPRADTHNHVHYDDQINKYVLTTRIWRDSHRFSCISYSTDFITWTHVKDAIHNRGFENQVYSMPKFKDFEYTIGLPSIYHEGDLLDENFDTVDVELSYQYRQNPFLYIDENEAFIERTKGKYQEFVDTGCIFSSAPIKIDDKIYFYYLASNGKHTNFREGAILRAYIKEGRYACATAKNDDIESVIYTNAFVFLKDDIYIDADILDKGYINIELFSYNNEKLDGYIVKLIREENKYKVKINNDINRIPVRLNISFKHAKLYSIEGSLDVKRIESDNTLLRL